MCDIIFLSFFKGAYKKNGVILKLIDYVDNRRYIEDVVDLGNIYL